MLHCIGSPKTSMLWSVWQCWKKPLLGISFSHTLHRTGNPKTAGSVEFAGLCWLPVLFVPGVSRGFLLVDEANLVWWFFVASLVLKLSSTMWIALVGLGGLLSSAALTLQWLRSLITVLLFSSPIFALVSSSLVASSGDVRGCRSGIPCKRSELADCLLDWLTWDVASVPLCKTSYDSFWAS